MYYSKDIISPIFISGTNPLTCISPGKFDFVSPSCGYISPVPGGVGPMTIASLMYNASKVY